MGNLSSIGFEVHDYESFQNLAEMVYRKGSSIRAGEGFYVQSRDSSGAELWLQMNRKKEVIGMNPHFNGPFRTLLQLEEALSRKESPMDGAFRAGFEGKADRFVFDLPDAHTISHMELPSDCEVQLALFADALAPAAGEAFGIRAAGEAEQAVVALRGKVRESLFKINGWTGRAFLAVVLDLGEGCGSLQVVAPTRLWKGLPPVGSVLEARGWLSGRVHLEKSKRPYKGIIERLFWG